MIEIVDVLVFVGLSEVSITEAWWALVVVVEAGIFGGIIGGVVTDRSYNGLKAAAALHALAAESSSESDMCGCNHHRCHHPGGSAGCRALVGAGVVCACQLFVPKRSPA